MVGWEEEEVDKKGGRSCLGAETASYSPSVPPDLWTIL